METENPQNTAPASQRESWRNAELIVARAALVPKLLVNIIRSVYARANEYGTPPYSSLNAMSALLQKATMDKNLGRQLAEPARNTTEALNGLGGDVVGSLCFLYGVTRKLNSNLPPSLTRPTLDEALLRAHMGYLVASYSKDTPRGLGMLAGFSSRIGFAVQLVSDPEKLKIAESKLAGGTKPDSVSLEVYGCNPYQVATLALISAGCNKELAEGVADSGTRELDCHEMGTARHKIYAVINVVEALRTAEFTSLDQYMLAELGMEEGINQELYNVVSKLQREGHGWGWLTSSVGDLQKKPAKRKARVPKKDFSNLFDIEPVSSAEVDSVEDSE